MFITRSDKMTTESVADIRETLLDTLEANGWEIAQLVADPSAYRVEREIFRTGRMPENHDFDTEQTLRQYLDACDKIRHVEESMKALGHKYDCMGMMFSNEDCYLLRYTLFFPEDEG
jgi:hypothetical protein